MKKFLPMAVAISVGLVTLLSYLFDGAQLFALRLIFVDWAVTLAGLAVLLGVINVLLVNGRRFVSGSKGWFYNFLTLIAALLTIMLGAIEGIGIGGAVLYENTSLSHLLYSGVILTSQAAIASLVLFALVFSATRMIRHKPESWSLLFLVAAIVALVGWLPFDFLAVLNQIAGWIANVPVMAGARGILLGVALGVILMGLRVLTGMEHPYRDEK